MEKEEKSEEFVLLKNKLNEILMNFDINFNNKGKNILEKVASNERMINY